MRTPLPGAALLLGVLLLAGCAGMPVEQLHLSRSMLTAETERFTRRDRTYFTAGDTVHLIVTLQWSNTFVSAGEHEVQWRWYLDETAFTSVDQRLTLFATPYELYGQMPASALGPGPHKVEVRIGERLIDTRSFEVGP